MIGNIITFLYFILSSFIITVSFQGKYILPWYVPFLATIVVYAVYMITSHFLSEDRYKTAMNIMTWLSSLTIPYAIGSLFFYHWKWDWISSLTMFRISFVTFSVVATYVVIMIIRARISYKKKRGNQRIYEEPKKKHTKQWKERKRAGEKDEEITVTLGRSTESEDRTPPV